MCFISHTNLQKARGEEKLTRLHLARPLIQPVQILVSVTLCCELHLWQPMYALAAAALLRRSRILYCGLLMSCSTGSWAQTCLCHSLGRRWAPSTSTCRGTGQQTQGLSHLGLDRVCRVNNGAGNSQPIICTKIISAETSSFHNRHPHTLFPFYLGFAHGFRIRIC